MDREETALANLFTSEIITPEQWSDNRRARHLTPEAELYFSILRDAVDCLRYRDKYTARGQKMAREAAKWLNTDEQDENGQPYVTVGMCCDVLGIDLEWLRRGLRNYTPIKLPTSAVIGRKTSLQSRRSRQANMTPARALRIVEMHRAGAPITSIRLAVGVSYDTIYKVVNELYPDAKQAANAAATRHVPAPMVQMELEGITT